MTGLPPPEFVHTDAELIIAEMKADYENQTGSKLSPGQAEVLLINAFAYRELINRVAINEASRQNLIAYARYPMLDYLGELLGVFRLPPSKALCTIQFTMVEGHGTLFIDEGIRVQSTDGRVVFITLEGKSVPSTDQTFTVQAECTTEGEAGNAYQPGDISIILDPQAFVASAANTGITTGGADQENDTQLRERIRLAPSSFSCAGPRGAYEYFAKSAHPSISDVGIDSPVPGTVKVYPLLENGVLPTQEIIDAVNAKLNDEKVRPLTDTVIVEAPTAVEYALEVNLTLLTGGINSSVLSLVQANLELYSKERDSRLGIDVVISQIIARCIVDGVYKVVVVSPPADIAIDNSQLAKCTGITVNIVGLSDE